MRPPPPRLSIVVPVWNEASSLSSFLGDLGAQEGLCFDVLLADGGSEDGSGDVGLAAAREHRLDLRVVSCPRGRARQMNRAAAQARAPFLLFLHADTRLPGRHLLAKALGFLCEQQMRLGTSQVAGHFGLRFLRSVPDPSLAYYFYEAKTRLDRAECIRGDQGMLLPAAFFRELGGFDESLPYLEDVRFAANVESRGVWLSLPGTLGTSARRFEREGLAARQTLNALLCNFEHIGMHGFFDAATEAYREQSGAGSLLLPPFFRLAHRVGRTEGRRQLLHYWSATGRYIAANAWQLAFLLDCRANQRDGREPGEGSRRWLQRYEAWLEGIVNSRPGGVLTACLAALWIYGTLGWDRVRNGAGRR